VRWPFCRRPAPAKPEPERRPLTRLTTVVDRYPAVIGFGLPDVAGTRSLLARPPAVPGPNAPRGRMYGTVVVRHPDPAARRGWLPSLRQLFAGEPSGELAAAPMPWAVRVIDRPPEPPPVPPLRQQMSAPAAFEPVEPTSSPDEEWMTGDD
jgi:hypothetical protein